MSQESPVRIMILTDGYVSSPPQELAQNIPVLWPLNNKSVQSPCGKVVRIKLGHRNDERHDGRSSFFISILLHSD